MNVREYARSITGRNSEINQSARRLLSDSCETMIFMTSVLTLGAIGSAATLFGAITIHDVLRFPMSVNALLEVTAGGGGIFAFKAIDLPMVERPLWRAMKACDSFFGVR